MLTKQQRDKWRKDLSYIASRLGGYKEDTLIEIADYLANQPVQEGYGDVDPTWSDTDGLVD